MFRKAWMAFSALAAVMGSLGIVVSVLSIQRSQGMHERLDAAISAGDAPAVSRLVDEGAGVNPTVELDYRPLMVASLSGHLAVVDTLMRKDGDNGARAAAAFEERCAGHSRAWTIIARSLTFVWVGPVKRSASAA